MDTATDRRAVTRASDAPSSAVDVVIVTHNSAGLIADAVRPLRGDRRVVVVDNASTDGTADVARSLGVDVIENEVNAGFGAAANRAIAATDAPYVLLLNPDASIEPGALVKLVRCLDTNPELAVVSTQVRRPDGSDQRTSWPMPSPRSAWLTAFGLARFDRSVDQFLVGACLLIRRKAFDDVGGFDARFWLYAEESDLTARMLDKGWRIELVPDAIAVHVGGASGDGEPGLVLDHFERGGEHFVRKHCGARALVNYRLANAVGSAIRSMAERRPDKRTLHRWRLRRTVRELVRHPLSVDLESPATAAPGKGLVVCSLEPWDEIWRRNQFLVRELLVLDPDRRVLFVEPPFDWVHQGRHRSGRRRQRGLRPVEHDGRIVRLEPGKVVPRLLGTFADRSLRRQVRTAARHLGFVEPMLWVNDSSYAGLPTETGWASVYDITDDWTKSGEGDRSTRRVEENERQLLSECEAVTVCSATLAVSRSARRADVRVIPNGVDVDHFRTHQERPGDLPVGPTAVYVGTLHTDRLDVALLDRVAAENPGLGIVLVGPDALDAASRLALGQHRNVHLLGARPYRSVPAYMQHADVVIVPHVLSSFTESLDPIKAYECIAVGRPTVATPVAGFRDLGPPVLVADRDGFSALVAKQVGERMASRPQRTASWSERSREFQDVLLQVKGNRR